MQDDFKQTPTLGLILVLWLGPARAFSQDGLDDSSISRNVLHALPGQQLDLCSKALPL